MEVTTTLLIFVVFLITKLNFTNMTNAAQLKIESIEDFDFSIANFKVRDYKTNDFEAKAWAMVLADDGILYDVTIDLSDFLNWAISENYCDDYIVFAKEVKVTVDTSNYSEWKHSRQEVADRMAKTYRISPQEFVTDILDPFKHLLDYLQDDYTNLEFTEAEIKV